MHHGTALEIGQAEIALAIAAVVRAEQGEQCGVLADRHKLAIAERPASRSKVEREDANFSDKWVSHKGSRLRWKYPEQRDDVVNALVGLEVLMRLTAADRRDRLR